MRLSLLILLLLLTSLSLLLPVPPPWQLCEPTACTLRNAPGVVEVEILVSPSRPTHRIIHVRDWHLVPEDLFTLDVQQAAGRALTAEEIATAYNPHLEDVEACQEGQMALLRHLAREYGIRGVRSDTRPRPAPIQTSNGLAVVASDAHRSMPNGTDHRDRCQNQIRNPTEGP
jgi:hypothetical protein